MNEDTRIRGYEDTKINSFVCSSRRILVSSYLRIFVSSLLLFAAGCATLSRSYDVAPNGLRRGEHEFRRFLSAGRADSALLQLNTAKKKNRLPDDELLRLLFEGVAAHYAGDHERSAIVFDRASLVTEDRTTRSIAKAALSVMVNDLALAYQPTRTERLLLPYYAALSYASAGKLEEAAVEARRLSAILQQLQDDDQAPDVSTHAFLRYFAGVVFEAAGERNDAEVAYRNAAALDSVRYGNARDSANVVLLLERGFAPHRVQESLMVMLSDDETHEFEHNDSSDERERTASHVAARILEFAGNAGPRTGQPKQRTLWVPAPTSTKASSKKMAVCDSACEAHEDHSYLLRMSWPVMYAPALRTLSGLRVDSIAIAQFSSVDLGSEILGDFQRQQPAIIARAVARAASKYVLTKSAEKKIAKKNEALGDVVGALANITGAITEQADTRSWHLLPGTIEVVRLRLTPGKHKLSVNGAEIGAFEVRQDGMTVVSRRVWHD